MARREEGLPNGLTAAKVVLKGAGLLRPLHDMECHVRVLGSGLPCSGGAGSSAFSGLRGSGSRVARGACGVVVVLRRRQRACIISLSRCCCGRA